MSDLKSEFLFDMVIDLDIPGVIDVGDTPQGQRKIVYLKGGTIEGPRIKGVLLPGGGDWPLMRADKYTILDVRIVIRTDDEHIIYMSYRGINDMTPETRQRLMNGEDVNPSEYYFRTTPVFETASEKYAWLNHIVAVGVGHGLPEGVAYKVYAIL